MINNDSLTERCLSRNAKQMKHIAPKRKL